MFTFDREVDQLVRYPDIKAQRVMSYGAKQLVTREVCIYLPTIVGTLTNEWKCVHSTLHHFSARTISLCMHSEESDLVIFVLTYSSATSIVFRSTDMRRCRKSLMLSFYCLVGPAVNVHPNRKYCFIFSVWSLPRHSSSTFGILIWSRYC